MTEQIAFSIALTPMIIGIAVLRISRNPRYLIFSACLSILSALLILILSYNHKYLSLLPFGLAIFILLVKWYRNRWEEKNRH